VAVKKTKKIKVVSAAVKPPIEDGNFSVTLSTDEMYSLVQILSFSKEVFEKMAENCKAEGNEKATQIYSARSSLSLILYERLKIVAGIGEPTSREIH
jgi:hypothetical protein